MRPGSGGSFWLSAARERYQKQLFFINSISPSQLRLKDQAREEGEREKIRQGGRRGGKEQQQEEEEDKNTLPLWRNSL